MIADQMVNGRRYTDFERVGDLFSMPFDTMETTPVSVPDEEAGNHDYDKVLRIIIPDPGGRLPWEDGCEDGFKDQLTSEELKRACRYWLDGR